MSEQTLPLAEHGHPISQFDALMALCDRLESSIAAAANCCLLLGTPVANTLAPREDGELEAAE